ncbi:tetratricopeptide repeat protein, partial [bacterium]|nr:tetratricopeptide repeat protein [bacterium]
MNRLRPFAWSIAGAAVAGVLVLAAVAQEPAKSESQKAFEAAQALYDAGQWDRALAAFRQFETNYAYSMLREQAVFFEGWCYYSQKKYDLAAQEFGRVRQTFARGRMAPAATLKEAESWREMKEFDKSLGVYREFQRIWPEDDLTPQSILGESWTLYKRWMFEREQDKEKEGNPRDIARAKELTLLVREKYKQNFAARMDSLFLLGQLYNAEENFAEARKTYEEIRSMRNNPRATEALFLAAEALYDSKQFDEAIRNYQRVKSKDALLEEIRFQIATLRSELPRHPERRNSILAAINEQQTFGNQVTGQQNLRPLALFRTANSYQELSRPEEACIVYRHFLRLYPEDQLAKQAHFGLTQALTAAGRPAEAERELDSFKKKYGGQEGAGDFVQSALFLKAKALFDTGKYQEAQRAFREFLETKPEARLKETAKFYIAGCDYGLENYEAARDMFAKFLADHPESGLAPDAQFRLARSYFELSQRAEQPEVRQENLTQAADQFEAYRTKHGTAELLPEAVFQLGYLYGYLGEFDTNNFTKAIGAFREFVEKWPDRTTPNGTLLAPEALYQVGTSQLALGDTDAAAATFQEVIDKYPDTPLAPAASFDIGRAYAIAGKSEELVAALRAFVARYPDHALVPRALLAMGDDLLGRNEIE